MCIRDRHIAIDIARRGGELENRCIAQVISRPDALHLIAAIGFDRIDTFDAGRDHAVALCQPVRIIDVGVALDGGIAVGIGKACACLLYTSRPACRVPGRTGR